MTRKPFRVLVALPLTIVLYHILSAAPAAAQDVSSSNDPRVSALSPDVRKMVLEEADRAKANCQTNGALMVSYECDCYRNETVNLRLKAGTETRPVTGPREDTFGTGKRFTKEIGTDMQHMSECISTPKLEAYGKKMAAAIGLSGAAADCMGREVAASYKRQPNAGNIKYLNGLVEGAAGSCMGTQTAVAPAAPPSMAAGSPAASNVPATPASDDPASRPATSAPASSAPAVVPLNSYRGFLLTVRDNPQIATHAALLPPTRAQVLAEQKMWATIQAAVDHATTSPQGDHYNLNPKRSTFIYEWQTEADASRTDLVDVFLRTDADWSFVTREPQWDSRFGAIVDAFLFSRKSVEGREASFAAQELVSVYKRHLDAAVAKAATKLFMTLAVPATGYDFESKSIRFLQPGTVAQQGRPYEGGIELLENTDHPKFEGLVLPASAGSTANYHLFGAVQSMHRADPPSSNPGVDLNNLSPTHAWRSAFSIGSSGAGQGENIPYVEVLALDRQLRLTSIPLDPARAEKIAKASHYATMGTISGLTAKVYFDADRVELSHRTIDGLKASYGVLFAKLQRVDIYGPDNELLSSFTPESLPAPAVRPATTEPPATKLPPEQTETLAERQTTINKDVSDKTASIVGDLKKKSDARLAEAAAASAAASAAAAQPAAGAATQSAGPPAGPDWQPCGDLKSGPSQTAVPVEFVNTSKQPRKLIWFDFAGAKIVAGVMQPGQRAPMQTYTTHAWMIADGSDQCLGTLVISKAGQIAIR